MKEMSLNDIRSGRLACSIILIISLLLILFYHCYTRSYAMALNKAEADIIEETITIKHTTQKGESKESSKSIEDEYTALAGAEREEVIPKTEYDIPDSFISPVTGNTVSYKGGKTIERSSRITYGECGYINSIATPDADGFMKLNDRYLIAVGTKFNTLPGQYIDLILENGLVIKCMMGDAKADKDTDATNTFTYHSRCCSEFIIDPKTIRKDIYERGNASLKYRTWDSPVVRIVVYDKFYS